MRSGLRRNGIGVHSSDRCHCVTSWPKLGGRVEWIISSLIPSESCNQRAMQVWQNHASDELCSIFRDGRSSTRPSRSEGHTRFSAIVRLVIPRQCAVEVARGRRDHPWSAIAPVVGRYVRRNRAGTSSFALNQTSETASRPSDHRPWSCPPGAEVLPAYSHSLVDLGELRIYPLGPAGLEEYVGGVVAVGSGDEAAQLRVQIRASRGRVALQGRTCSSSCRGRARLPRWVFGPSLFKLKWHSWNGNGGPSGGQPWRGNSWEKSILKNPVCRSGGKSAGLQVGNPGRPASKGRPRRCCLPPSWSGRRGLVVREAGRRTPRGPLVHWPNLHRASCDPPNRTGEKVSQAMRARAQMSIGVIELSRCRQSSVGKTSFPTAPPPGGGPTSIYGAWRRL